MTFTLSDKLLNGIISAMENQEQMFLVDAENGALVPAEEVDESDSDKEQYYSLPDWGPAEGFALRQAFVEKVHVAEAHQQLQAVLHSGRGVFKNFRNVLKDYPEIEKRWHIFKYKFMSEQIKGWYNALCEVWGLEKLEQLPEPEESFLYDDFSFRKYEFGADSQKVVMALEADFNDCKDELPEEVNKAILEMWKNQFLHADSANQSGIVCQSYSDDFAGVLTSMNVTKNQEQTVVITCLFVPEQFRGLGICSELLSKYMSDLQAHGTKWILIPSIFAPEIIQPLLTRTGFRKINSGYLFSL